MLLLTAARPKRSVGEGQGCKQLELRAGAAHGKNCHRSHGALTGHHARYATKRTQFYMCIHRPERVPKTTKEHFAPFQLKRESCLFLTLDADKGTSFVKKSAIQ